VLGAGATASTAFAALHALGCAETTVVARDPARAGDLADAAERIGIAVHIRPWAEAARHVQAGLVVSALPPGAADPLAPRWLAAGNTLLDVVYRPWPTPLARAARRAGSTVIGGLPMLVHQDPPAPLAAMWRAAEHALRG
jgi:shikimate dehydrogenase